MRLGSAAAVALVTASYLATATADPAQAAALATEAEARAAAGDFVGAAGRFRAAYAADPQPYMLCNVGVAFRRADDLPRAQLYLAQCLGRVTDPKFPASWRAVLTETEALLAAGDFAPVDVTPTPPTAIVTVSTFDPDDTIIGARLVWLPLGVHTLRASADGHVAADVAIELRARAPRAVRIDLERTPTVEPERAAAPRILSNTRYDSADV